MEKQKLSNDRDFERVSDGSGSDSEGGGFLPRRLQSYSGLVSRIVSVDARDYLHKNIVAVHPSRNDIPKYSPNIDYHVRQF
eukprot:1366086-Amphidinium_carterae.1